MKAWAIAGLACCLAACGVQGDGIEVRLDGTTVALLDKAWAAEQLLAVDGVAGVSLTIGQQLDPIPAAVVGPMIDDGIRRLFVLTPDVFQLSRRGMRVAFADGHGLELEGVVHFEVAR